jgi:heparanase 1
VERSRRPSWSIDVGYATMRYTLSAHDVRDRIVQLNGNDLKVTADGDAPDLRGSAVPPGTVNLPPVSITFLAVAEAGNGNCR